MPYKKNHESDTGKVEDAPLRIRETFKLSGHAYDRPQRVTSRYREKPAA